MASRRGFLLGLGAALAAPAIVRADSLMKIAVLRESLNEASLDEALGRIAMQYPQWRAVWGEAQPYVELYPVLWHEKMERVHV